MALEFKYQTELQFCKRLHDRYKVASGLEACRLMYKTLKWLTNGDLHIAKVLNAWNLTQEEWDIKVAAKYQYQHDKYAAYKADLDSANQEGTD